MQAQSKLHPEFGALLARETMKKIVVLESLRGFAALYVFLGHFFLEKVVEKSTRAGFLFRFGQEAVMMFFLMSGFVIYMATERQADKSFAPYFWRRFLRIYPIFFLSLAIAYAVNSFNNHGPAALDLSTLLGNLSMLQDFGGGKPGVFFSTYKSNRPLWSLSYEWWFYMMFFPIHHFVAVGRQKLVVAGLALMGFASLLIVPNQIGYFLTYFIVWWTGVEFARTYCSGVRPRLSNQAGMMGLLLLFCVLQVGNLVLYRKTAHLPLSFGMYPVLEVRHFGAAFLFALIALLLPAFGWKALKKVIAPFAVLAPISYALYVLHYPLAVSATYLQGILPRPAELAVYALIAFGVAYLAEGPFQKWINSTFRFLTKKKAPTEAAPGVGSLPLESEIGTVAPAAE